MKLVVAILAVILIAALVYFRTDMETGPMALARCKTAVSQAKSWTVETSSVYNQTLASAITRNKISCPDDYEYFYKTRTTDNVIREQSTIRASGETYIDTDGTWAKSPTTGESTAAKECGKGPLLVQQTVFNAIDELPRRRAGKMTKGERQTINGESCQDWSVDYGNEWPQTPAYTICISRKTHLPVRITYESGSTNDFSAWNNTTITAPADLAGQH